MIDKKYCVKCNKTKSIDNFHFNKNTNDGFHCYCKWCRKILSKEYHSINKERENKKSKEYHWANRDVILSKRKSYFQKNKKQFAKKQLERLYNNPKARIRNNVSSIIWQRLNRRLIGKNNKSTLDILPYTIEQLMQRLESKFTKGMTWRNYGKWHIDHIIPDCRFDYTSVEDDKFKECWKLSNLQPLWAGDNLSKNKY